MRRSMLGAASILLWALALAVPATADVDGQCTVTINGVEIDRIESISSPLELGDTDVVVFSGTDDLGTETARIETVLGPLTVGRSTATYGTARNEFYVTMPLTDPSAYAIGLLRVRGITDNCTAEAWVRVGGRLPFITLAGLIGTALAIVGLTIQILALTHERSWSLLGVSGAGIATGTGCALLGQQFGRLQLSYPSLTVCVLSASLAGLVIALYLRLRERPRYRGAPRAPRVAAPTPAPPLDLSPEALAPDLSIAEALQHEARATGPETASPQVPYWGYVVTDVEVLHLDDYSSIVATLQPGTWYLVKRQVAGWAHVVASDQVEGWVPAKAVCPHETD